MTIDISKNKKNKNKNKQTSRGRSLSLLGSWVLGPGRGRILKSQVLVPGVQIEERERKIDEEKKTRGDLACKASVSVRFRCKERGRRVKDRAKMFPEALVTQNEEGKLLAPMFPCIPPRFPCVRFNSLPII